MSADATLLKRIRSDPAGYREEFLQYLRRYEATVEILRERPNEAATDFSSLVRFVASVADAYPTETRGFGKDLYALLERNHDILDPDLRRAMVQSLIQLRQRRCVDIFSLLPLFFRLFSCKDKSLRQMLFGFIVADMKKSNRGPGGQQHQLNRQMKGFLLTTLKDPNPMIAKKALAILTELWRRQVWHDVHTANVIASAVHHPDVTVMYAAVKFFLGYDLKEGEEDEEESPSQGVLLSADDVYKAQKKGTRTSKKKKLKKLKRVKAALAKEARQSSGQVTEQFAAIQLLQDPYTVAETLFSRARSGKVPVQTRLSVLKLVSRIIAVHRLVMLNFYSYLQKYLFPGVRDVLTFLAALVEGCHDLVPPDALETVLRQLVDQFVHDRARPEVIATGLKAVREMCARAPLIMTEELLSDLVQYRKFKDSEVRSAAKGLISLFREIAPQMLPKKERGRAGNLFPPAPLEFGKTFVHTRLEGAELLQAEKERGSPDSDLVMNTELDKKVTSGSEDDVTVEISETTGAAEVDPISLTGLRKKLLALKAKQQLPAASPEKADLAFDESLSLSEETDDSAEEDTSSAEKREGEEGRKALPIEMTEILVDAEFERLRELKRQQAVELQLKKFGLTTRTERRTRQVEAAEAEADELLKHQDNQTHPIESGLNPAELLGKKKGKANKTERVQAILRGRDGAPYRAKASNKKRKTGGLSNREKIRRKQLPLHGRMAQAKKRRKQALQKRKGRKNHRGHVK